MSWKEGSFGKAELKKHLGLSAGNSDYSEGSSTGVKNNEVLGEGYLSKGDYERLLGNDKLKKAFIASGGDADSWSSVNDVDTAVDYLTKGNGGDKDYGGDQDNIELSPRLATARARATQYEEDRVSGQMAKDLYNSDENPSNGFLERYKMKLGDRLENGNYTSSTNSSKVASGQNDVSVDAAQYSRTGKDNRKGY